MSGQRTGTRATPRPTAPSSTVPGFYADPHLVVFGGRFYLFPTTDGFEGWTSDSFRALSSSDLKTWTDHGQIFSVPDQTTWATGHAWAPAVAERNGSYFLYFTANSNIGVARADDPLGPYTDLGRPLVAAGTAVGQIIDPAVFVDDDNTPYLLWGNGVAHIAPLDEDMMSFDPSRVVDFVPTGFREALFVHKRAGIYYLSWSENDTRHEDYRVRYATASSLAGPWTDRGILVEKDPERGVLATGHHSIVRVPGTDDWLIAYHRFAIPDGNGHRREVVIDDLHHEPGGLLRPVSHRRSPSTTTHSNER